MENKDGKQTIKREKYLVMSEGDVYFILTLIKQRFSKDDWKKGKEDYIQRTKNVENAVNYMANRYCFLFVNGGDGDCIRILEEKITRYYEGR